MTYDFVAIGDITTDAFIRLKDAEVHCNINNSDCELCVKFGQKIPYKDMTEVRAVGNAANAAVAAHRIGLSSALMAWLGNDENGSHCLETLRAQGVSDQFVTTEDGKKTNYHYVLMYGPERTILIKHEHFTYRIPKGFEAPRYIYFSSISGDSIPFHHTIAQYVNEHPETKLVFQPGTFQIDLGKDELKDIYAVTDIFFCNKEESQQILNTQDGDIKNLLHGIHALGPKTVFITDGPNGSYVLDNDGMWKVPMYPDPAPPVSRTGAGDATASTTVAYIAKGLSPHEALMRGAINSASVVQGMGAQTKLLTDTEIDEWYARRPEYFVAQQL